MWSWFKKKAKPDIKFTAESVVNEEPQEMTDARRSATNFAQKKDYVAAAEQLKRVHEMEIAEGAGPQSHSEIRRAKYLQKANQGSEAWSIYQQLVKDHRHSEWVIIDVLDAMRLHLQREDQTDMAIHYGVAHRLARMKLYRGMKAEAEKALNEPVESYGIERLEKGIRKNHEFSIELAEDWISRLSNPIDVEKLAKTLCRKAGKIDEATELTAIIGQHISDKVAPASYLYQSTGDELWK